MALTQISTQGIKDGTITGTDLATNVDLVDNQKLRLGTGNDLEIFHNGTDSFIDFSNALKISDDGVVKAVWTNTYYGLLDNIKLNLGTGLDTEIYHDGIDTFINQKANALKFDYNGTTKYYFTPNFLTFQDNFKAAFGTGQDLQIYHNGLHSNIEDAGTGVLILKSNGTGIHLQKGDTESLAKFLTDGAVELYHDNSKKFETLTDGVSIPNDNDKLKIGASQDLYLWHNGSTGNSNISNVTGDLFIQGNNGSGTAVNQIAVRSNAAVELNYQGTKKFETTSAGVLAQGHFFVNDNNKFIAGTSNDLQIFHDGSHSFIDSTLAGSQVLIRTKESGGTTNNAAKFMPTGAVELYYDGSKKFETHSGGINVTGSVNPTGNVALLDNSKAKFGDGDDLQIYHDGSHSYIQDAGTGTLRIQSSQMNVLKADGSETMAIFVADAEVGLFYDNSKKFETRSGGAAVIGHLELGDNDKVMLGDSNDLQIFHNTAGGVNRNDIIAASGTGLKLQTSGNNVLELATNSERSILCRPDGATELYFDGSKQFETTTTGTTTFGTHHSTSDIALKTNIKPITNTLEKIQQITGYKYKFIKSNENSIGVVAQEVEKVFPELVAGTEGNKTLQYNGLIGILIEAVKELSAEVAALKAG